MKPSGMQSATRGFLLCSLVTPHHFTLIQKRICIYAAVLPSGQTAIRTQLTGYSGEVVSVMQNGQNVKIIGTALSRLQYRIVENASLSIGGEHL